MFPPTRPKGRGRNLGYHVSCPRSRGNNDVLAVGESYRGRVWRLREKRETMSGQLPKAQPQWIHALRAWLLSLLSDARSDKPPTREYSRGGGTPKIMFLLYPSKRCSRGYSSRRVGHCSTLAAPGAVLVYFNCFFCLGGRLLPYLLRG